MSRREQSAVTIVANHDALDAHREAGPRRRRRARRAAARRGWRAAYSYSVPLASARAHRVGDMRARRRPSRADREANEARRRHRACRASVENDAIHRHGLALVLELHRRALRPAAARCAARMRNSSERRISPSPASAQRRLAVLTVSPMTVNSSRRSEPMLPANASPKLRPMPICSSGRPVGAPACVQLLELMHHLDARRPSPGPRRRGRRSARPTAPSPRRR